MRAILLIWLAACTAVCAQDPAVEFDIAPKILRLGESATARVTVKNMGSQDPIDLPQTDGWRIQRLGSSTSNQVTFSNGKQVSDFSIIHSFRLTPLQTGETTFGPYTVENRGEDYELGDVTVKVIGAG